MTPIGIEAAELAGDARRAALDAALQRYGAQHWRIENRSEFQATVAEGKDISHLLHFFLTLVTLGAWAFVWLTLCIFGGVHRRLLTVDPFGSVVEQKL